MFAWDNAYDGYSAAAINEVMRRDIQDTTEEDGYHFRSLGCLQQLMWVFCEYEMTYKVVDIMPGFTLQAIKYII